MPQQNHRRKFRSRSVSKCYRQLILELQKKRTLTQAQTELMAHLNDSAKHAQRKRAS